MTPATRAALGLCPLPPQQAARIEQQAEELRAGRCAKWPDGLQHLQPQGALLNHTAPRDGRASAVCQVCCKHSRPMRLDGGGEPSMWDLPRGWSTAPFPADFKHRDGSQGSTYTCPACNKRLRAGERLQLRAPNFFNVVNPA